MRTTLLRLLLLLSLAAVPAFATERQVSISAPAEARPGSAVHVSIFASTEAIDGEQIGFVHAQYSLDGGKTWVGICFEAKVGALFERTTDIPAGAAGSKVLVRVRAAFRGGKGGDVDVSGAPIKWDESWENYRAPIGKFAIIYIR